MSASHSRLMKACSSNDYPYLETISSVISGIKPNIKFVIKRETRFIASFRKILSAKKSRLSFPVLRKMLPGWELSSLTLFIWGSSQLTKRVFWSVNLVCFLMNSVKLLFFGPDQPLTTALKIESHFCDHWALEQASSPYVYREINSFPFSNPRNVLERYWSNYPQ